MAVIPVAEWRPDVSFLNSAYTANILNVLCADGGYIPFPTLGVFSDALAAAPNGAFTARDDSGTIYIFAGTTDKLFLLNNTDLSWSDVSGASYSSTSTERWRFAQFGLYVVAVNANDPPQVFELGTSSAFADLGGSPPNARYVSVCGDFLMLSGLPANPQRIQWSALNDITGWTPGTSNSDYQDFPDGGEVYGVTSTTNPFIIQRSAVRLGTFVPGSLEIFTFQKIMDRRGAAAPYSICTRGALTFFADSGGFFQLGTDGSITPIGREKVDRTVFTMIDGNTLFDIVGEVDPFYSRVYFAVRYASTSSAFDRMIIYDWDLQRWTQVGGDLSILFPLSSGTIGYTLDNLSDLTGFDLDNLPFSLDSQVWQGGAPVMAAFNTDNQLCFFAGAPAEAIINTQEMGQTDGTMGLVTAVYPAIDTNDVLVSIGGRRKRGDQVTWTQEAAPSSNTGVVRKKKRARFHQYKMRVPEGTAWTFAQGVDVTAQPSGSR